MYVLNKIFNWAFFKNAKSQVALSFINDYSEDMILFIRATGKISSNLQTGIFGE